jgi:chromosome segregation ATPase
MAILAGEEPPERPSFRDVILCMFFVVRWRRFKKGDPPDSTVIREFVSPVVSSKRSLRDSANSAVRRYRELEAKTSADSKKMEEMQTAILKMDRELRQTHGKLTAQIGQNAQVTREFEAFQKRMEGGVSPSKYSRLVGEYDAKVAEQKALEKQVQDLRSEMEKVLDGIDGTRLDHSDLQVHLTEAEDEIEKLKQMVAALTHELEIAQAGLRDKTREILALERQVMRQKTQVVVVKDQIPTAPPVVVEKAEPDPPKSNFYISEAVRNGLAQMQSRMMRQERLI